MTCHVTSNHRSSPHATSQPTTLPASHPANNFILMSPPWNSRRLVHSKEMVWASRWSVALRTFYKQILSLLYISFFFWNFRPRLPRELLVQRFIHHGIPTHAPNVVGFLLRMFFGHLFRNLFFSSQRSRPFSFVATHRGVLEMFDVLRFLLRLYGPWALRPHVRAEHDPFSWGRAVKIVNQWLTFHKHFRGFGWNYKSTELETRQRSDMNYCSQRYTLTKSPSIQKW